MATPLFSLIVCGDDGYIIHSLIKLLQAHNKKLGLHMSLRISNCTVDSCAMCMDLLQQLRPAP